MNKTEMLNRVRFSYAALGKTNLQLVAFTYDDDDYDRLVFYVTGEGISNNLGSCDEAVAVLSEIMDVARTIKAIHPLDPGSEMVRELTSYIREFPRDTVGQPLAVRKFGINEGYFWIPENTAYEPEHEHESTLLVKDEQQ